MKEFNCLDDLFRAYCEILRNVTSELLNNDKNLTDNENRQFRLAREQYYNNLTQSINRVLDEAKKTICERAIVTQASQNPFYNIEGERIVVFPTGTKFWFRGKKSCTIVVEEPPQVRTIRVNPKLYGGIDSYQLPMPTIIFILIFNYGGKTSEQQDIWVLSYFYAAFVKKPLTSIDDDKLYEIPLPDMNGYVVCLGKIQENPVENLAAQTHDIVNYFWHSEFQKEWMHNVERLVSKTNGLLWPLSKWQALTLDQILQVGFIEVGPLNKILVKAALDSPGILLPDQTTNEVKNITASIWESVKSQLIPSYKEFETLLFNKVHPTASVILKQITDKAIESLFGVMRKRLSNFRTEVIEDYKEKLQR
jgi:hypothetical protein